MVIVFFLGTRGDYPVAALVTEDAALHLQIVEGPTAAQTMDVLHGGAGGDFRSLLGLSALTDTHRVVFYNQRGAGLSKRVTAENLTLNGYLEELDAAIDMTSFGQLVVLIGQMGGSVKLSWSNQLRQADKLLGMA